MLGLPPPIPEWQRSGFVLSNSNDRAIVYERLWRCGSHLPLVSTYRLNESMMATKYMNLRCIGMYHTVRRFQFSDADSTTSTLAKGAIVEVNEDRIPSLFSIRN